MEVKDQTMLEEIESSIGLAKHYNTKIETNFFEFDLEEVGLPSAEELLQATKAIEEELGELKGWRSHQTESTSYKGFSLCYNPNNGVDAYATLGDPRLKQNFSRSEGLGDIDVLKNSYHDTYRFSKLHPVVAKHYKKLFDCFNFQPTRSRVSYIFPVDDSIFKYGFHKDEFPFQNLRVNIPLQTSEEYVLEIAGEDEYGNRCDMVKHMEVGKCYIWNTRIPHRAIATSMPKDPKPRISIILGFMPWINVDGEHYEKSEFFGQQPFDLLKKGGLFK